MDEKQFYEWVKKNHDFFNVFVVEEYCKINEGSLSKNIKEGFSSFRSMDKLLKLYRKFKRDLNKNNQVRFLVFAGSYYYPCGGCHDLIATRSNVKDAIKLAESLIKDWVHIYDSKTNTKVWDSNFEVDSINFEKVGSGHNESELSFQIDLDSKKKEVAENPKLKVIKELMQRKSISKKDLVIQLLGYDYSCEMVSKMTRFSIEYIKSIDEENKKP